MAKPKFKILVIYKSGAEVTFTCSQFHVRADGAGNKSYSWADATPNPLQIGADDVAAVWQLSP